MKKTIWLAMAIFIFLLNACATKPPTTVMHQRIAGEQARLPSKLLLLPLDVSVSQLTASGNVDEDPEWCNQARERLLRYVQQEMAAKPVFSLNQLPELTKEEQARLDEHLALFDLVAGNAMQAVNSPSPVWNRKRQNFDYSIGSGLADFKARTGADVALIVIANDYISTGGRKAMSVAAAMLGVVPVMGYASVFAGVVDLQSGDILWLDYAISYAEKTLLQDADVEAMVKGLFESFPSAREETNVPQG